MAPGEAARRHFSARGSDRATMLSAARRLCEVPGVREVDVDLEREALTVECIAEEAVMRRLDGGRCRRCSPMCPASARLSGRSDGSGRAITRPAES